MRKLLELIESESPQCFLCGGPAHPTTGWLLNPKKGTILCGRCAKEFAAWYKARMGQMSSATGKQKKLAKELGMDAESFAVAAAKSTKGE